MKNIVYFIENLTVVAGLFYVLPQVLRDMIFNGRKIEKVYFIDSSRIAGPLARLFLKLLGVEMQVLKFRLVDIKDEAGNLLRLRIAYKDLAEVRDEIKDEIFKYILDPAGIENRLTTFLLKQTTSTDPYNNETIWRALLVIQIVNWKMKREHHQAEAVIFLNRRYWLKSIVNYAKSYQIKIVPVFRFVSLKNLLLSCGINVIFVRRIMGLFSLKGLNDFPKKRRSVRSISTNPKICVEYYGHLNLDRPELYSDLSFLQQANLLGENILVTFGLQKDPLDENKWKQLEKYNIFPIALSPQATTLPHAPVFNPPAGKTGRKLKRPLSHPESKWLTNQLRYYYSLFDYWSKFFFENKVKIYTTWFKYSAAHCVIADALQSQGGVTAIYQRAFEELPSAETTIAADLVFGFSKEGAEIEKLSQSTIDYYVTTGYLGDYRFPLLKPLAQEVRQKILKGGAKKLIAFFDENSVPDSRWHTGHEFMRQNYAFLLEKVLKEPWLGVVLKPKVPATLRQRLGEVAKLLEQAEKTGRCFVFEGGAIQGSFPPAIAALAADVTIHGHLCAATGGLEAALAGATTLLIDREGWPMSKLYKKLDKGKVIFTEWPEAWGACLNYFKDPKNIPGFGDWKPILHELDPFQDGKAAFRMGTYLKWILEGFLKGYPRERVLAEAAQRYTEQWGADKVIQVNGMKK